MSETVKRNALMDERSASPRNAGTGQVCVFLPIVLGCSHACTYCVIPSRRGKEHSRPPAEILAEASSLAHQGVKEITLLGQIVDRYGGDLDQEQDLSELLCRLSEIDGIERIRYLTSHPNLLTDRMLETTAGLPKVCPHIEVPVQAGDDKVLAAMRRGYTADDYRKLVARIRTVFTGRVNWYRYHCGFSG